MKLRLQIQAILPTVWISPMIDQTTTAQQTAEAISLANRERYLIDIGKTECVDFMILGFFNLIF